MIETMRKEALSEETQKILYYNNIVKSKTDYIVRAYTRISYLNKEPRVYITLTKDDDKMIITLIHELSEIALVFALEQITEDFKSTVTHYATVHALDENEAFLVLPF